MMITPSTRSPQFDPVSSGTTAISASTDVATAACSVGSLVAAPAMATAMTAPTPAQNHEAFWISGYNDTDARITATAEVTVSLRFIPPLPVFPAFPAGSARAV